MPFPGPQEEAYHSPADELFYGGAGGGGKSSLGIGLALTTHRNSLILRREASQLSEIVEQLREFAPPGSRWRGVGNGGVMRTTDGRRIEVGGIPYERDKHRYQGRPIDLLDFDECTEFTESMVDFVSGWLRSTYIDPVTGQPQRCRLLLTGNPPLSSVGLWIISRYKPWLDPAPGDREQPGVLRWYARVDQKEERFEDGTPFEWRGRTIRPQSRTFIPASLADNPKLRDTDYASRLAKLPPALRDAILEGDFGVSLRDDPWQVIPSAWIKAAQARWREDGQGDTPLTRSGLDCIYGGTDRMVLARRYGDWVAPLNEWTSEEVLSGDESEATFGRRAAGLVLPLAGNASAPINVDVIGYGAATYEALADQKMTVMPISFGEGASGYTDARGVLEFANIRALAYWTMREALDPDLGSRLALPDDEHGGADLRAELAAAKYEMRGGRIYIRPKDEIAAELGRSPDLADACVLSCFMVGQATIELL